MDGNEVIALARRTYVEEFAEFVRAQGARFQKGEAEVATARPQPTPFFGGHYRVDFIGQGPKGLVPMDLVPDTRVRLETPSHGNAGPTQVTMEQIVWDDVAILHDIQGDIGAVLSQWFNHWYDVDDRRGPTHPGGMPDVIHWLRVTPGSLVVDFGSASTNAFWALIALLRDAGAKAIIIRETRPPPPPQSAN